MEKHSVSRIIGSPPGYVGYDEAGQLTEKIRRKPYSVILFDEIEKAHPDIWGDPAPDHGGRMVTDAQGRKADFKNAIVVLTSNVGAARITAKGSKLGFSATERRDGETRPIEELKAAVLAAREAGFRPDTGERLPVFATVIFDEKGKLLTGGDVSSTVALLEGLGVDVLGINCGLGPVQMKGIVEELLSVSSTRCW